MGLEIGNEGWTYGWAFDLPGCFSRAGTRERALDILPSRIERFVAQLRDTEPWVGLQPRAVRVVEEVHEDCPVRLGDTRALFAWDLDPPTEEEFERDLRWMSRSRETLLALVQALPLEILDRETLEDAGRKLHDARAPSIRRILRHVAGAEYWYLSRLAGDEWLPGEELPEVFEMLDRVRSAATPALRELFVSAPARVATLEEMTWSGTFTERWTLRKVLRRALWHEQFHIEEIRLRIIESPDDRSAVGAA